MRAPRYNVPLAEFQLTLAEIRRQEALDRAERELRQHEADGRALCERAERENPLHFRHAKTLQRFQAISQNEAAATRRDFDHRDFAIPLKVVDVARGAT